MERRKKRKEVTLMLMNSSILQTIRTSESSSQTHLLQQNLNISKRLERMAQLRLAMTMLRKMMMLGVMIGVSQSSQSSTTTSTMITLT